VETDYGLIPIYNVLKGMYVKTKDGMRIVSGRIGYKSTQFNFFIDVKNFRIRFTKDQLFYQKGKPVEGRYLKQGQMIDFIEGEHIITKKNASIGSFIYYTLVVDSPRSNFCLHNGLIVCN
jgi:hypothetical protein